MAIYRVMIKYKNKTVDSWKNCAKICIIMGRENTLAFRFGGL